MNDKLYADIIIETSHEQVDRIFQYRIPERLMGEIKVGDPVVIPFGSSDRLIKGYCVGLSDTPDYPVEKLKEISDISGDRMNVEAALIELAWWMKSHYGGTMIQALRTVIPIKKKVTLRKARQVDLAVEPDQLIPIIEECENRHQTARLRVLNALLTEHTLPYELMRTKLNVAAPTLKSLEEKGLIRISETDYYRNPVSRDSSDTGRVALSSVQKEIITTVTNDLKNDCPGKYLIHGITGSGKTEVYLGIAEETVRMGYQVIVLIPEISLTYQTLLRFYKRFGDRVSVVNSSMSEGERYDRFMRAKNGELDVIIGPRSALFTPFSRLGAIIIDEEHENSYKSENTPRYHARECAAHIAETRHACLVLGSATPSLEAYYRASLGQIRLFKMNERLTGGSLPIVHTVDMRQELRMGNRTVFSEKLQELIGDRLDKGEQSMLFINRRGMAGFVSCRSCGYVVRCSHCDVSLTEHRSGKMVCHYCGYSEPKPKVCPKCGSRYIAGFRAGTETVENSVREMFPRARVLRMDSDTTAKKGSMEAILCSFQDHEADILVGTQMIVKGHDFPMVTLMGILAADMSLNAGDYHAAERTFQLLTQAAGRAGRGNRPGEVVIQTYQPEHYSITAAAAQDYDAFYEEEIAYRQLGSYPPAWHLLAVLFVAEDEKAGMAAAEQLKYIADGKLQDRTKGYAIGPAPASIGRIRDRFRFVLYVKHGDLEVLANIRDLMEKYTKEHSDRRVLTFYDFDPAGNL